MSKKIETPRRFIRYSRSDITLFIREKGGDLTYVELLNISQQGISCRMGSNIRLKRHLEFLIKFNESHNFELKGYIVNKSKDNIEEKTKFMDWLWGLFMPDYSFRNYGVFFNEAGDDFKLYLIRSNMQRKLE